METNETYSKLAELWTEFSIEHSKSSKAAHNRARRALTEIKKLTPVYKKSSIAEDKVK